MKKIFKFNFFFILFPIVLTLLHISYRPSIASENDSGTSRTSPSSKPEARENSDRESNTNSSQPIVQISLDKELSTPKVDDDEIREEFARTISTSRGGCQSDSDTKYAIIKPLFDRGETLFLDSAEKEISFQVYQTPSSNARIYLSLFKKGTKKPLFLEPVQIEEKGKLKVKINSESLDRGEYNLLMVNYCEKGDGYLFPTWELRASLIRH